MKELVPELAYLVPTYGRNPSCRHLHQCAHLDALVSLDLAILHVNDHDRHRVNDHVHLRYRVQQVTYLDLNHVEHNQRLVGS